MLFRGVVPVRGHYGNRAPKPPFVVNLDSWQLRGNIGLWDARYQYRSLSPKKNVLNGVSTSIELQPRGGSLMGIFNDANDQVRLNGTPISQTGQYTIWVWAWADSLATAWQTLIKNWAGTGLQGQCHFGRDASNSVIGSFLQESDLTVIGQVTHHINMPIGELVCWATRADGAELSVWQNGIKGTSPAAYDGTLRTSMTQVEIGNKPASAQGWQGGILLVGWSDQAFSDA